MRSPSWRSCTLAVCWSIWNIPPSLPLSPPPGDEIITLVQHPPYIMSYYLPHRRGNTLIRSLVILLHSSMILAQSCYFPSGDPATEFTPCNGTASASHCCQKGSDACLTSGLCYMKWDHSINAGTCTDRTWRDPSCFQLCPKTTGKSLRKAHSSSMKNVIAGCGEEIIASLA